MPFQNDLIEVLASLTHVSKFKGISRSAGDFETAKYIEL